RLPPLAAESGAPSMLTRPRVLSHLPGRLLALILLGSLAVAGRAAVPTEPAQRAAVIGQPTALVVQPAALDLSGPRAMQQIVVTGKYADGSQRDLTPVCDYAIEGTQATVSAEGFVLPRANGNGQLVIKAGAQTVRVPLAVKEFDKPQAVRFRHEVIGALNVGGCNAGACH